MIPSNQPAIAALEIPAGSAKKWNIAPGVTVNYPFFTQ
jgi:uncharacterized membrane protein (UPF0127 family)